MEAGEAEAWIRAHVQPTGEIEVARRRPWSTVLRVPTMDGLVWFKACGPVMAFEPRLTAQLFGRWPDRVPEVIAWDEPRAWLLLRDAGTSMRDLGNPPEVWLDVLPRYAELQLGEAAHARDHLDHGVPDLRLQALPSKHGDMAWDQLPLQPDERRRLRSFAPRLAELCVELAAYGVPESIQHDDLHFGNVYASLPTQNQQSGRRVMDWGDASISHPFASLVVTFRFLQETHALHRNDPWFARLRDAYLEPWGLGFSAAFALAMRVGQFAHVIAWARQRAALTEPDWPAFDRAFRLELERALALID